MARHGCAAHDGNYDHCWVENLREVSRVELAHRWEKIKTREAVPMCISHPPQQFANAPDRLSGNGRVLFEA
jgi:hypothetical protein